jgi:hypothetical protein
LRPDGLVALNETGSPHTQPHANDAAASKTNVTCFIFISLSSLVDFDFVYRRDNADYRKQCGKTGLRKQALE